MKPITCLLLVLVALVGCAPQPRYVRTPAAPLPALSAPLIDDDTVTALEVCADLVLANAREAQDMWHTCRDTRSFDCRSLGRFLVDYMVPDYRRCWYVGEKLTRVRVTPLFQHRVMRAIAKIEATNDIQSELKAQIKAKAGRRVAEGR